MNHVFELKTGKKIELTSDELSEFIALTNTLYNTIQVKIIWQSVLCPMPITQYPDPNPFRKTEITCGSV